MKTALWREPGRAVLLISGCGGGADDPSRACGCSSVRKSKLRRRTIAPADGWGCRAACRPRRAVESTRGVFFFSRRPRKPTIFRRWPAVRLLAYSAVRGHFLLADSMRRRVFLRQTSAGRSAGPGVMFRVSRSLANLFCANEFGMFVFPGAAGIFGNGRPLPLRCRAPGRSRSRFFSFGNPSTRRGICCSGAGFTQEIEITVPRGNPSVPTPTFPRSNPWVAFCPGVSSPDRCERAIATAERRQPGRSIEPPCRQGPSGELIRRTTRWRMGASALDL